MHFGAFVERLGQTPYAEAFAGLRVAVLQDDIEIEPATQEFDVAVQKMLAEPLRRELDMLQRKMEGGHATDDDKERLRWLVGEISRRRRLV
jgi:DNA primase